MKVAVIQIQASDIQEYRQAGQRLIELIRQTAAAHDLVIVPECAYPAYYLDAREADIPLIINENNVLLAEVKSIAAQHGTYIAYGYAEADDGRLYNTAVLIDRQGREVAKKRKSYLWHFDNLWFTAGEDLAVADTDFGRVGLVVCCDARSPEIVRLAALAGADLVVDLANLTATGPHMAELHNAQSAYMLSVRAMENGVWLAVADKWGVETDSIVYTGRSAVYGPDGTCYYQARADRDEIVSVDIPTDANGRIMREPGRPLPARRPDLYSLLLQPADRLPIVAVMRQPAVAENITPYITAVTGDLSADAYIAMIRRLGVHGSQLICMPPSALGLSDLQPEICQSMSAGTMVIATMRENDGTKSYALTREGVIAVYATAHTHGGQPFVLNTAWGNIGIMHDEEGLLPEWGRILMLAGADCVVWPNALPSAVATPVARTRAAENRMFVVVAQGGISPSLGQIIDPNGAVVASTLQGRLKQACGTYACLANSRMKQIVPGTHIVTSRQPDAYASLVQEA